MKRWWRIEVSANGKVVSCEAVDAVGDEPLVVYVQAQTEAGARELARKAWNKFCRERLAERRARYKAEGRCRCGRPRDGDHAHCKACRDRERLYDQRALARQRGEYVPVLDRREVLRNRQEADAREARKAVLLEVLEVWNKTKTDSEFTRWLATEIGKLRKLRGAA